MKKILAVAVLLASSSASAVGWTINSATRTPVAMTVTGDLLLTVERARNGQVNMYFYPMSSSVCRGGSFPERSAGNVMFNGRIVPMTEVCESGLHSFFPSTLLGRDMVFDAFVRNYTVLIQQGSYNGVVDASGFIRTLRRFSAAGG